MMRNRNRIKKLKVLLSKDKNKKKVLEYFFKPKPRHQFSLFEESYLEIINKALESWKVVEEFSDMYEFWDEFYDLRLTQILIHYNILENIPGMWFYIEDEEIIKMLENE